MTNNISVIETCKTTENRLTFMGEVPFRPDTEEQEINLINIYCDMKYQMIEGFGGAFTESSAAALARLSAKTREEIMTAYFDKDKGIGYNFCRTHIGSCDYSVSEYSYDDVDGDFALKHFSIARDREFVIPMIKNALELAPDIKIFASPWSPPAWMKTNNNRIHGGKLRKDCQEVWAKYMAQYIKEYQKEGIPIWGVTVQNEAKADQNWESCIYTAKEEREFVTEYLWPTYQKEGMKDIKIISWDHNKERVVERAKVTYDGEATKCFYGSGVHWYSGDHFDALDIFHTLFPDKHLIGSEACTRKDLINPWYAGERYAHGMIGDLNHWVCAWTDWNLLLDENSGPSHWREEQIALGDKGVYWFGNSPIMVDTQTDTVQYGSAYYYMGHFSKYIKRGAKRIGFSIANKALEACAFENPDGQKVVIVFNGKDEDHAFTLRCEQGIADFVAKGHSILTLLY